MKLSTILTFLLYIQVSAESFGQQISLHVQNKDLTSVMRSIKSQTGISYFVYGGDLASIKINLDMNNKSLDYVMNYIKKKASIDWVLHEGVIIVRRQDFEDVKLFNEGIKEQQIIIRGRVIDRQMKPIPNITVVAEYSNRTTKSNDNGEYQILVERLEGKLIFTGVGYQKKSIEISGNLRNDIILESQVSDLDEVIVVGYGQVRKGDLTGAISTVRTEDLATFPSNRVSQALMGRSAGVNITQNSGAPNARMQIRIRGTNSIFGSNEPLWIIDGFPGNPDMVNSSDIERIEILKDASATAIYGSRGANGVVIVTTKKGSAGVSKIEMNSNHTVQTIRKKLDLMNAQEYAKLYNVYWNNIQGKDYFTADQVNGFGKGTDWQDLIMRKGNLSDHTLNIIGGNDKTQFSLGGSLMAHNGIIKNSGYDRNNLRGNIQHKINNYITISANTLYSQIEENPTADNNLMIHGALAAAPTVGAYNESGGYTMLGELYPFSPTDIINPVAYLNERSIKNIAKSLFSTFALEVQPISNLRFRFAGNLTNTDNRSNSYVGINFPTSKGSASLGASSTSYVSSENTVNYERNKAKHRFTILAGFTYEYSKQNGFGASGSGFFSDVTEIYNLGSASTLNIPYSNYQDWKLLSFLSRLNYNYDNKYLLTLSMRGDGSSRYSLGNKWGVFPSGAFAWRFSEESLFKNKNILSDGKLRVGYGITGSTSIDPYYTLNMLSSGKSIFENSMYTYFSPGTRLPSKLKWESTSQTDIGIDLSLFNHRLSITADYYHKITKDLLNTVQLPRSTGYSNTVQNIGSIENKGFEFMINSKIIDRVVKWDLSTTMSFNRNKVLKLHGGQDINGSIYNLIVANDFVNVLREGQSMSRFYGYQYNGLNDQGRYQYKDLNEDGLIDQKDKTWIGNPNPKFIYGLNSSLSYKNFDLSVFVQGTYGNDIFGFGMINQNYRYYVGFNTLKEVLYDHFSASNQNAKYPKIDDVFSTRMSDNFVYNGSYLRLKNISLGYRFPVGRVKWIQSAKVYISGQNLLTITGYPWWDPEVNTYGGSNSINQGIDYYSYPTAKGVTIGLNLIF